MAKIVSFVALVVVLLVIGGLFLRVMAGFLLPLFLALLLVIIFGPLHRWFLVKCGRHNRVAALLATVSILGAVLIPLTALLLAAGREAQSFYLAAMDAPTFSDQTTPAETPSSLTTLVNYSTDKLVKLGERLHIKLNREELTTKFTNSTREFLAPMALRTTQFLGQMLISLLVMILAVYYFFADGPAMIQTLLRLSPLEVDYTRELIGQFDNVTRAVVAATLLSAFAQGLLVGAGFYVAGIREAVFLLTALAMLLTLVPFVGSAIVWAPVCLWLFGVEGRTTAAVLLAIYCLVVAVTFDNVVKSLLLHGRSNLHPLLALLSVLGGVQSLGPIGVLVGPMVVAFLQTLLNMVHTELSKSRSEEAIAPA